eukprot:TRINITY_DN17997_c0_g1_i2.p1 TRINITY_DN17997_c0_g1~~TRINITY_DN17997_c0_g1_i2.p1  ORF type:complete len:342 (+),score=100.12 TRINITY_DN17997_c0_g1_i2:199-1224(+)
MVKLCAAKVCFEIKGGSSLLLTLVVIVFVFTVLLWKARQFIQGYWFDQSAPNPQRLDRKTAIVTGANSGLGLAASIELAKLGAKVHLACRSKQRGEDALKLVRGAVPGAEVELVLLDVSSMDSVEAFAAAWRTPLDILVCNAGIASVPPSAPAISADTGVCTLFQTNFLGHYHLTNLLLPRLKQAAAAASGRARIVNVSSGAHKFTQAALTLEEINESSSKYGLSKLAQIMAARALQRKLDSESSTEGVKCVSVTPGFVRTNIFPVHWLIQLVMWPLAQLIGRSAKMGAQVIVQGAACEVEAGAYYSNCYVKDAHGAANDVQAQDDLCKLSDQLVERKKTR